MRKEYIFVVFLLGACAAANEQKHNPLSDYEQVELEQALDVPTPTANLQGSSESETVQRGAYLVNLLGCGACHSDGALAGQTDPAKLLAGSNVGIAYTNPLENKNPAVVYPKNLTPDNETGLGKWTAEQIATAIQHGVDRKGQQQNSIMPWRGYQKLRQDDLMAIVSYLQHLEPVRHMVPERVVRGVKAKAPFVHFGVYRSRGLVGSDDTR